MTPTYIFIQTGRNLKQSWGAQVMTLLTVSLSVLIFSFFLLIYLNMQNAGERLADHLRLIVYLENEIAPNGQDQYEQKIRKFGQVDKILFKSRADAYDQLERHLAKDQDILADLGSDFLPPSIEIYPRRDLKTLAVIKELSDALTTLPGVLKVQYGREWIERFGYFTQLLRLIVFLSAVLLFLSATFMVSSTIRLTVVSRQAELEVLRLLGATKAYFQTPLLIEGFLQGLVGAGLGLWLLHLLYSWIEGRFSGPGFLDLFAFTFLPLPTTAAIYVASLGLCTLGSFISIRKFLRI